MATLEEVSTSAREEDLDRRSFQIDNLQITKLDSGRLYATKENKKENDRSLRRELPPSWVSKDIEWNLVTVQDDLPVSSPVTILPDILFKLLRVN